MKVNTNFVTLIDMIRKPLFIKLSNTTLVSFQTFLDAEPGYELYKGRGCEQRDEIESSSSVTSSSDCAQKCSNRIDCPSFEYKTNGDCKVSSSCIYDLSTSMEETWLYVKIGYSSKVTGGKFTIAPNCRLAYYIQYKCYF